MSKPTKRKKAERLYVWTCQYCGQPFETPTYSQRYCSNYHRQLAYKVRKSEHA